MSEQNLNLLQNKNFSLVISRTPNLNYFCKDVSIPGLSATSAELPTPFTRVPVPGDHVTFNPLTVTFNVDEDLRNYEEIFNWIVSYSFPSSHDEYKDASVQNKQLFQSKHSDITVFSYTNHYNPNISFVFENAYPVDLGDLNLDISQPDVTIVTCTATFEYTRFYLKRT